MPKVIIDYSNTIIYKITCKDKNVTDIYVGHTTNFVQRKHAHKQGCINNTSPKVYDVIRNNGGWSNWVMEIINFFNCKNLYEAKQYEQEYFISLHATLNSVEPLSIKSTPKIQPLITENNEDIIKEYFCKNCNYTCDLKQHYKQHCLSKKHNSNIENINIDNSLKFNCKCGKIYKDRSGLWKHLKLCKIDIELNNDDKISQQIPQITPTMFYDLLKQNNELQKIIINLSSK